MILKPNSLRFRLGVLFILLFLLVTIAAGLAVWSLKNQQLWLPAVLIASALVLLGMGAWLVHQSVITPLQSLGAAAQRIGENDFLIPVQIQGAQEIQALAEHFEQMRLRLQHSQDEIAAWTETLEQRVALRTRQLAALHAVSREITSQLDLNQVLNSVAQKTKELLNTDVVFLCLMEEKERVMNLCAFTGPETAIRGVSSPVCNPMVQSVLAGERAMRCNEHGCQGYCEIIAPPFRTSHLAAPLRIGRQIIGALCVGCSRPASLNDDAVEALTQLASVAAIALQNARLYEQAERAATLEERQRIAAEMHDGLAQTLSYLRLAVEQAALQVESDQGEKALATLERAQSALLQAVEDTRRAIASLQEQPPLRASLQDQLCELAQTFEQAGLLVSWLPQVQTPLNLPRQESEQVLRVAREALLNAQRHAQAARIELHMDYDHAEHRLSVTVKDDGVGFDLTALPEANGAHFGLKIMRARATRLGGRLEIDSRPGWGTSVRLTWPREIQKR